MQETSNSNQIDMSAETDQDFDPLMQDGPGWLVVHDIGKSYKRRTVVTSASLAVKRGEAVGLLGPNGAGKTTVFYMITGLVRPDKGYISLDGF